MSGSISFTCDRRWSEKSEIQGFVLCLLSRSINRAESVKIVYILKSEAEPHKLQTCNLGPFLTKSRSLSSGEIESRSPASGDREQTRLSLCADLRRVGKHVVVALIASTLSDPYSSIMIRSRIVYTARVHAGALRIVCRNLLHFCAFFFCLSSLSLLGTDGRIAGDTRVINTVGVIGSAKVWSVRLRI
jgi:hypothetical protein